MVSTTLSLIAFFALIARRFVFTDPQCRPLGREIAAPRQQHTNVLDQRLNILDPARVAAIPDNRFENGSDGGHPITPKDRAKTYLRRIAELTGARETDTNEGYVLEIGTTRFYVRDRYVGRTRDVTDPQCAYEETCFYSANKEIPRSEHIASALLQLKNNPALFDRWAAQNGAFKADGQVFTGAIR